MGTKIKTTKKYLKLYKTFLKYSLIGEMAYKTDFITQIIVELGHAAILVVFFQILYSNVSEIAGWSYYEVLFLTGLNIVNAELLYGMVMIFGLLRLPGRIKDGDIDFVLTKPINSMFQLSLGRPYFSSFLAMLPGFYIMGHALSKLDVTITWGKVLLCLLLFLSGLLILYAFVTTIASLAFKFINMTTLPELGASSCTNFKKYPHSVFSGVTRVIFMYIIPVGFMVSIPASALLKSVNLQTVITSAMLATLFMFISYKVWNLMIKQYSSASS